MANQGPSEKEIERCCDTQNKLVVGKYPKSRVFLVNITFNI